MSVRGESYNESQIWNDYVIHSLTNLLVPFLFGVVMIAGTVGNILVITVVCTSSYSYSENYSNSNSNTYFFSHFYKSFFLLNTTSKKKKKNTFCF